jgi:hypothetical protein
LGYDGRPGVVQQPTYTRGFCTTVATRDPRSLAIGGSLAARLTGPTPIRPRNVLVVGENSGPPHTH